MLDGLILRIHAELCGRDRHVGHVVIPAGSVGFELSFKPRKVGSGFEIGQNLRIGIQLHAIHFLRTSVDNPKAMVDFQVAAELGIGVEERGIELQPTARNRINAQFIVVGFNRFGGDMAQHIGLGGAQGAA